MTADTSVVIAGLADWHPGHAVSREALRRVTALPSHALLESYSTLTRLPSGLALAAEDAAVLLGQLFPDEPLVLSAPERQRLPALFAAAGVSGGACYDGLVALEARAGDCELLTRDRRAARTYAQLGAAFTLIG